MKMFIVTVSLSAVFALTGCGNKGGSSDDYNTRSGAGYSTNYQGLRTNDQGGATSPSGLESGGESGIAPKSTNNVP